MLEWGARTSGRRTKDDEVAKTIMATRSLIMVGAPEEWCHESTGKAEAEWLFKSSFDAKVLIKNLGPK